MGVTEIESNCNALGNVFQGLINDMRDSVPAFQELVSRTTKLHSTLRTSMVALAAFLEAFQKVADVATGSKGATKEIGKSLTRLCLRHRSIENKLKVFTNSLMEELVVPLQEKLEDWKRNTMQIDKDHAKDYKSVRLEIKKASSDTIRLQKKAKKAKGDANEKLESAMVGVTDKFMVLEECKKTYTRKALLEERRHYCDFICFLRPVVDSEMSMVHEIAHLQEIVDHLSSQAADPDTLPDSSEQVIRDVKGSSFSFKAKTPPDSPTSDRHSLSSSMNSLVSANESDTTSQRSASPTNRLQPAKSHTTGLLSVASLDSGFTSQDALHAARSNATCYLNGSNNQPRRDYSVEEERSDSLSVYSSVSQGSRSSHDYDTVSLHSGPAHPSALHSQLKHQLEKAHTIGGVRPVTRPGLSSETYDPPSAAHVHRTSVSEAPPRPQRMDSRDSSSSRRSSLSSNRSSLPPKNRTKPKPVALPSVPFMDSEPIYMNTQELAQKIAEKKLEEARKSQATDLNNKFKVPTTEQEEREDLRYSFGSNISAAVKELEASTAALNDLSDYDILVPKATNDALADALKELEATTAALNDCYESSFSRQSVVSSSGYGTTTSNSSASEEVQVVMQDTVDTQNHTAVNMSNHTNHISGDVPSDNASYEKSVSDYVRQSEGVEVTNWAGTAVLRRQNATSKPPPPERRSSSVSSKANSVVERKNSQKGSKPPLLSPKPKISPASSRVSSRASNHNINNECPLSPPPPPPPAHEHDDTDPYAVPTNCQPIDSLPLPPPPPEFDVGHNVNDVDTALTFNLADLPPPLPDTPPPSSIQRSNPTNSYIQPTHVTENKSTANTTNTGRSPPRAGSHVNKLNSKGAVPPPTLAKKGKKLNSNFMAHLDAKLGGPQTNAIPLKNESRPPNAALDSLMNNKSRSSPSRDNLLSQIHGGVRLRRAENINDRSAPII